MGRVATLVLTGYHAGFDLSFLSPESLRIQTCPFPCLLAQSADHIPRFTTAVFQRSLGRYAVLATNNTTVWSRKRENSINECPRLRSLRTIWSFVKVNEHDHRCMHWLVIPRPTPLEWLEIRVRSQGYELLHEAMAVTEGTLPCRWPNATFGVLQKRLIGNTKRLENIS